MKTKCAPRDTPVGSEYWPAIAKVPNQPKEPGSNAKLRERQEQRRAQQLNRRRKPIGTYALYLDLSGQHPHSLYCRCDKCLPIEMRCGGPVMLEGEHSEDP